MAIDLLEQTRAHSEMFAQLNIDLWQKFIVVPEQAISWNQSFDLDQISSILKTHNKGCLLSFDTNPTTMFDRRHDRQYLLDLAATFGSRVRVLSHNLKHVFDDTEYVHFPFFLLQQRLAQNHQSPDKKYRMSFLSNQPRFHRLWFYQRAKRYIQDHDCFAVHIDDNMHPNHNFIASYCRYYLGQEHDLTEDLPFFHDHVRDDYSINYQSSVQNVDWSNANAAYSAMFNIAGESISEDDQILFSEKTWKCIRSRCLLLNLGSAHANHYLQKMGFQTAHDVDLPLLDKVEWICDRMRDWTIDDCREIFHSHRDLIEHNYHRFYSEDLARIFREYLRDRLEI